MVNNYKNIGIDSKPIDNAHNKRFHSEHLSTIEGYEKINQTFEELQKDVLPGFQKQLDEYRSRVLKLCGDYSSVIKQPEIDTIVECNSEFSKAYGKRSDEALRNALMACTSDDYGEIDKAA